MLVISVLDDTDSPSTGEVLSTRTVVDNCPDIGVFEHVFVVGYEANERIESATVTYLTDFINSKRNKESVIRLVFEEE